MGRKKWGRKPLGPFGPIWAQMGPFGKRYFGFGILRARSSVLEYCIWSGHGVEASFRQCGRGSEGDIFQNRPKQSKNAQNCLIRHFWQTPRPLGFFFPLTHGLPLPFRQVTTLLLAADTLLVSAWCDFRRLKPPFLKPPPVFP